MKETFDYAFATVVGHEGGFTADRRDRGNWTTGKIGAGELKGTKFGISAMSYPRLDIKNLTVEDAKAIYLRDYWNVIRGDDLPVGIDYMVFDAAVNHGNSQAAKFLQQAVGASVDGRIGPLTLGRVQSRDPIFTISEFASIRMGFYTGLSTWATYGRGWTRRLVDTVVNATSLIRASEVTEATQVAEAKPSFFKSLFRSV